MRCAKNVSWVFKNFYKSLILCPTFFLLLPLPQLCVFVDLLRNSISQPAFVKKIPEWLEKKGKHLCNLFSHLLLPHTRAREKGLDALALWTFPPDGSPLSQTPLPNKGPF